MKSKLTAKLMWRYQCRWNDINLSLFYKMNYIEVQNWFFCRFWPRNLYNGAFLWKSIMTNYFRKQTSSNLFKKVLNKVLIYIFFSSYGFTKFQSLIFVNFIDVICHSETYLTSEIISSDNNFTVDLPWNTKWGDISIYYNDYPFWQFLIFFCCKSSSTLRLQSGKSMYNSMDFMY